MDRVAYPHFIQRGWEASTEDWGADRRYRAQTGRTGIDRAQYSARTRSQSSARRLLYLRRFNRKDAVFARQQRDVRSIREDLGSYRRTVVVARPSERYPTTSRRAHSGIQRTEA